jgi:hypothetical protein
MHDAYEEMGETAEAPAPLTHPHYSARRSDIV